MMWWSFDWVPNYIIIRYQHTMPGQVGFVMKKKFCHETFLTSSRGILIARNFSKEKKYSYVREWSNFCIGESSSDFFNIPTWNASLVVATQFRRGYVLSNFKAWLLMGDDIGSGLSSMAVCFDFCSTNVVQLRIWNQYFYRFRCHHQLITQFSSIS